VLTFTADNAVDERLDTGLSRRGVLRFSYRSGLGFQAASGVENCLTCSFIPVEEAAKTWMKDPEFRAAYDALETEFALAAALIKARGDADMTQEQVAAAMETTQAAIARLESGRIRPTTRTLEQFAKATHTRLRISFEPEKPLKRA